MGGRRWEPSWPPSPSGRTSDAHPRYLSLVRLGDVHFPGVAPVADRHLYSTIESGQPSEASSWWLDSHAGTHVDAPRHFLADGATIERLSPDIFFGPALVWDVTREVGAIEPPDLPDGDALRGVERLLLRTSNVRFSSDTAFHPEYVALSLAGALHLVGNGVRLVGIDYLSIEALSSPEYPVHKALFRGGSVPLEGLDLSLVPPGRYTLIAVPLKLQAGEASPVRALLID